MEHRFALCAEFAGHFVTGAPHAGDESRIVKLRNSAAKVTLWKLLRCLVFAKQQTVLQGREEGYAEVVIIDTPFETARLVSIVDYVSIRLYDVRIDSGDEAHDPRRVPIRQPDESSFPFIVKLTHRR